jgi:hypothetical protein
MMTVVGHMMSAVMGIHTGISSMYENNTNSGMIPTSGDSQPKR